MKEFTSLRAKALERRDKAITKARDEYADTIGRIFLLERDLKGHRQVIPRRINESIDAVIPPDGPFTVADIAAFLVALEPGRDWKLRSIHYHLSILHKRGIIKRIKRCTHDEPAVFVRAGEKSPSEPKTLLEAIVSVLGDRAMNLTEITVAILDMGYSTRMKAKVLRGEIATAMRRDGRFRGECGKWSLF